MDGSEIISIIIAIGAYIFFTVRKYKKKEEAEAQRRRRMQRPDIFEAPQQHEEAEPIFETVRKPKSYSSAPPPRENVPKSDEYFTYEDSSAPIGKEATEPTPSTASPIIQEADIEDEIESVSLPLKDEIDKAILYSEILKRPYN